MFAAPDRSRKFRAVRRHVSTLALVLAWLCANGAVWDVVQIVAWGRMFTVYSSYLPTGKALERTFDGSKPCEICEIAQHGRDDTQQQQSPSALGGGDRLVLACDTAAPVIVTAPDFAWPGIADDSGRTRTDAVPVPPPRV